jgi:opacity protein-like surface antigen
MRRFILGCALALALTPGATQAQTSLYRFELTPTVAYRWGGTLSGEDNALFETDLELDSGPAYGVTLDIPLSSRIQLELLFNRQSTELSFDRALFGGAARVADIDVSYYHVGLLWQGGHERVSPFFVASIGGTNLDPQFAGGSSEDRFSLSLGGGVKIFFSENIGLRLEGRGFFTELGNRGRSHRDSCYYYDDYYGYYDDCYGEDLSQGQASIGLIFAW